MTRVQKAVIASVVVLAVLLAGWSVVFAAVWTAGGMVRVAVDPGADGPAIRLMVPMAAIDAALSTGRYAVGDRDLLALDAELEAWAPLVRELLDVLAEAPDATLVEVEDGATHVRIAKRHGELRVYVVDADVSVSVSLPARSAARSLARLLG